MRLRTHKPEAINWQYIVGIDETQLDAGDSAGGNEVTEDAQARRD